MSTSALTQGLHFNSFAVVSLLIAVATSYVAFDLVNWIEVSRGRRRALWLVFGSLAVGGGIWTTNILGTEAQGLPGPIRYEWPVILAARIVIVLTAAVGLIGLIRPIVTLSHRLGLTSLVALGAIGTHLLGLSALRLPGRVVYSPGWCLTCALAVCGVSYLALRLSLSLRSDSALWSLHKAAGAGLIGVAVALTYRTAASAIHFVSATVALHPSQTTFTPTSGQRAFVVSAAAWSLALCFLALRVDRRLVRNARQLVDSTTQLQTIFDNMTDGVIVWDLHDDLVMMNRAASELLGIPLGTTDSQVAAQSFEFVETNGEVLPYDEWPRVKARRGEFVRNSEVSIRRKDTGSIVNVEINTTSINDPSGAIQQVIVGYRDVRERTRLDETQARLAAIVESSEDAVIGKTTTGVITSWNTGAKKVFGFSSDEMVGQSILKLVPEDRRDEEQEILERLRRGETVNHYETIRIRRDGQPIHVSLTISPIRDARGRVVGASKIARDVTKTKRLEHQLRQSQKMDAIGQLTGGIAHDFNNLLGIVIGNLDLLERGLAANDASRQQVDTAQRAALRGADLTRRLLTFVSAEALSPAPTKLHECVRNVVEMATRAVGPEISISTVFDENIPELSVDVAGLESSLLNLLVNARDAMPKGGTITIRTQLSHLPDTYPAVQTGEMKEGTYACVSVSDTGVGMSRETLEHAIEPFFTTKPRGKGTGLGLAMVYGFAKQSGGTIRLYSESGYGTTISLYLPLSQKQVIPAAPTTTSTEASLHDIVVLIVDDELDLLSIAAEYVSACGYQVLQAANAAAALRLIQERADIGLLVTDIVMPGGINGVELARQAIELNPSLKVIYSSGFPADALTEGRLPLADGLFLHKPYQRQDLAEAIRRTMHTKGQDSIEAKHNPA